MSSFMGLLSCAARSYGKTSSAYLTPLCISLPAPQGSSRIFQIHSKAWNRETCIT